MSTANRVIKNTGWLYAKMAITMFVSLYTTRLILNGLGASDFGIFNIVGGAIAMLGFLNAAMASATQRFMSYAEGEGNKEKQKYIFNISIVLHAAISVIIAIALIIAGYFFFNGILNIPGERINAAKVVYASLIVSTMLTVINVPYDAVMNAHENMKYYAVVGFLESLLKLSVAFACVYTAYDKLIVYGILMACIPLVTLTIMKIYCHRHYEECVINPVKYWDKCLIKEMTSFVGWSLIGSATSLISKQGISIVINIFFGPVANAAQGIANQISGQFGFVGSALLKSISPVITKSVGANNHGTMERATFIGTKTIFFVVSLIFIPIIIETPFILKLWLINPPQYAVVFCRLLFIENRFADLVLFLPIAVGAYGKIKGYNVVTSIISFLPLLLSYLYYKNGAPAYTVYVILIATRICGDIAIIYYANKFCNIHWKNYIVNVFGRLMLAFSLTMFTSMIVTQFLEESWLRLFIVILLTILTYTITQWFIGFTKNEQAFLIQIIRDNIRKFINKYMDF